MKVISSRGVRRGVLAMSVSAAALVGTSFSAQAATEPAVPKDCGASTQAFTAGGRDISYTYSAGVASTSAYGPYLGYQPVASQNRGAMGDTGWYRTNNYIIAPTGYLWDIEWEGTKQSNGTWSKKITKKTVLSTRWSGIRALAFGYPYMYGLTKYGINRYSVVGSVTPHSGVVIGSSGWSNVTNLTFDRTVVIGKTSTGADRKADVLLAVNKANGYLMEYTIPYDTPTKWTRKDLRTSGWNTFTSLSTGNCGSHPGARTLLGIKADGRAYAYYDANSKDGLGSDIRGGSLAVATGWTQKAFNQ